MTAPTKPEPETAEARLLVGRLAEFFKRTRACLAHCLPDGLEKQGALSALEECRELAFRAAREI